MCPFVFDKGTKRSSDFRAKRFREGPSFNGIGTMFEKKPN
jgi:hypothetical protein